MDRKRKNRRRETLQVLAAHVGAIVLSVSVYAGASALPSGALLDGPAKHILAEVVIGAAEGLEAGGWSNAPLMDRVDAVRAETVPELRMLMTDVHHRAYEDAIGGYWNEAALAGYLDAIEVPTPRLGAEPYDPPPSWRIAEAFHWQADASGNDGAATFRGEAMEALIEVGSAIERVRAQDPAAPPAAWLPGEAGKASAAFGIRPDFPCAAPPRTVCRLEFAPARDSEADEGWPVAENVPER
ncbi:hypothetical protein LAZ40_04315 [Cereibacter sphaeroides]|uniref:hypothetical protein n=1 Tax=Cereibacter sphaeroides TaxID=1063 RepID=UPI001F443B04|nr:hypothetical protein [Cereibacter sphaeroides]MCE6958279.1 hypothetical protein [Cereibacter sphaeroides]MCE6971342.1 hypothetical protein [Cereibacter sphaeroides]